MNVFCRGGKVIGSALAWELIQTFLAAQLQDEGARGCVKSWKELMDCIASKGKALE